MAILEGFLLGVATLIFIGPVLFTLLQITLTNGTRAGIHVALGIVVSDMVVVALFYFGAIEFFKNPEVQYWLAVMGSVILLLLGLKYLFQKELPKAEEQKHSLLKNTGFFAKGFLVNFVNPFVFFVWISIVTLANSRYPTDIEVGSFLVAALVGIFSMDTLKVLLAQRIEKFLRPEVLRKLLQIIGIVLIGFAIRLIYFAVSQ